MEFESLPVAGAFRVRIARHTDERGFFARTYCADEFGAAGLPRHFVQSSISYNHLRGTVRGLHFQWPPSQEGKLVRCVSGALLDVLLDLRPDSATYLTCTTVGLDAVSRDAVYVPHGVAHGFQTLSDATEVLYLMTDFHAPELAAGVRWNDGAFGIDWPIRDEVVISDRDRRCPVFDRQAFEVEWRRRLEGGR